MPAFFITATGTDIGKTFVTAGLIRHLRGKGVAATALKPILSGFDPARAADSDSAMLLKAMGEPVTEDMIARLSPWRFAAPLSPDMAAAREGREIPYSDLLSLCRSAAGAARAPLFIEGVGGAMVPLDDHHTVLDWMESLRLPTILVSGGYLGTISHTLTALHAMESHGLHPAALVLNGHGGAPVPLTETAAAIARYAPGLDIVCLPEDAGDADFSALAALLPG